MSRHIWALADLHLAFGVSDKKMDVFGPPWIGYTDKIESHWRQCVQPEDLILIPGDISWALHVPDAKVDLDWIDQLPGTKVLLRGNHDLWWGSLSKVKQILPPSCHVIQNNSFLWEGVSIGGSRLWDTEEYNFKEWIEYKENPKAKNLGETDSSEEREKIFLRELGRLEMSLQSMDPQAKLRIAMTHYPPIGANLQDSRASRLLEKYHIDRCVFGHLHNVKKEQPLFGTHHGIRYELAAADYLDFKPLRLASF
jgi:uncharacterized protein